MNFHQNPNGRLAHSIETRQLRTALCQAVQHLRGREPLMPVKPTQGGRDGAESGSTVECADTAGRRHVRRALGVGAAGSPNPLAMGSTPTPAPLFSSNSWANRARRRAKNWGQTRKHSHASLRETYTPRPYTGPRLGVYSSP